MRSIAAAWEGEGEGANLLDKVELVGQLCLKFGG